MKSTSVKRSRAKLDRSWNVNSGQIISKPQLRHLKGGNGSQSDPSDDSGSNSVGGIEDILDG